MAIATLVGNEVASLTPPRTQVYQATHDGQSYLPFMQRSFISFSYGGKNIEDFNVLAYTSGDRMEREGYAEFEDLTSTYDTIQGQFYWGTYFHQNTLSITLATDAMTQVELDNFKRWFRAGSIRELIMAEHPNRAIMARIATPPQLHLLGFKQEVEVPFASGDTGAGETITTTTYSTYTTVYRGEIDLEFVMDEPFWYSIKNVLGTQNTLEGYYEDSWVDANGKVVRVMESPDALKIIYEDHIPLGSTTHIDVFLGGGVYASVKYEVWSRIPVEITEEQYNEAISSEAITPQLRSAYFTTVEPRTITDESTGTTSTQNVTCYYRGAVIAYMDNGNQVGGKIGGAQLSDADTPAEGISLPYQTPANLYYAGTAPSPVKLRFSLSPQIRSAGAEDAYYIITPLNSHSSGEGNKYNTITLKSVETRTFKFTLPTFWLSYNQVLEIFSNDDIMTVGGAWLNVREAIRDTIRHPVIRAWANMLINKYDSTGGNGTIQSTNVRADLKEGMSTLLCDNNDEPFPAHFTFDGKTGLAIGKFTYRDISRVNITSGSTSLKTQVRNSASGVSVENYTTTQEENVGDMVRSNYLILDERNVLDENYQVQAWTDLHPDYAYLITHDVANGLHDLHFEFKNMYL